MVETRARSMLFDGMVMIASWDGASRFSGAEGKSRARHVEVDNA